MSGDERRHMWGTWAPLADSLLDEPLPAEPRTVPAARNGMPEHKPYRSPPGTLTVEVFSGHCKRGKHPRCTTECGCFCHD
jgi:hypothetical protein